MITAAMPKASRMRSSGRSQRLIGDVQRPFLHAENLPSYRRVSGNRFNWNEAHSHPKQQAAEADESCLVHFAVHTLE